MKAGRAFAHTGRATCVALALSGCDPFGGAWTALTDVDVTGVDAALGGDLVLTVDGEAFTRVAVDGATGTLPLPEVLGDVSAKVSQVQDDGVFVGASERWLQHFVDSSGGEDGVLDAPFDHGTGWAVVESVFSQGTGVADPQLIALEMFPPDEALDIAVALALGDAAGRRIVLVPEAWFADGGALPALLFDSLAAARATIPLAGAPPDSHMGEVVRSSTVYEPRTAGAVERVLLYEDAASDGFTADDLVVGELCVSGAPARLVWVEPPTDAEAARDVLGVGMGAGWSVGYDEWGDVAPARAGDPLRGPC
ncbi:hypothetical protein LBMAG42_16830 [Deltaproteobacteria bacterium]|nr:hypothetical protein LBMAG42_16830 [Deltaproteobacteria bacterium]